MTHLAMTPHLVTEHVLIDGKRICHGVHGEGDPLVLIHGTPSSSYIWRDVLPALAAAGHRVFVYDLLGYGLSERPWDPAVDTSVTAQVPVLEGLMGAWGLERAHVIAHDIGGAVAKRFALDNPERVRTLTLIDPVSFDSWPSPRTRQQMRDGLGALIAAPDADHRAHFRAWLRGAVKNTARFEAGSLDTFLDFIAGPVGQGSLFQHQVRHYEARHTLEIADRLPELGELPVQILWGEDDAWQVMDWAFKLQAAIPGSDLHILKDCGHFAMEDQPEQITALLLDFLKRRG